MATNNYFTTAVTNGPLTAPSTTTIAGGNGVYAYGGTSTTGVFPTSTYGAANYLVDVVFLPSSASNTPPTAVADAGDATEKGGTANGTGGATATGNVLTNDTDPNAGDTKTVSTVSFGATTGTLGTALAGAYGSLVLNASGVYTYTVNETNSVVQALRLSTNTLTEVFNYTMRDTAGATSSTTLTVTIHGANDSPVLAVQTGNQSTSVGSAFTLALPAGTFTDVDSGDTLTYGVSALPAWSACHAATRMFSGTPTSAGTVNLTVSVTDTGGVTASETFNIVVTSTPNTPPTAVADIGDATERGGIANATGGSAATGNVLTNDSDQDVGDTKTVSAMSFGATAETLGTALAGAYGSLVLSASGAFTYTVNETSSAVQALRQSNNALTEVFGYDCGEIRGRHLVNDFDHHHSRRERCAGAYRTDRRSEHDHWIELLPDAARRHVHRCRHWGHLTYAALSSDGSALPAWLAFNPTTRTFSGTPSSTGTVGVRVSATDSAASRRARPSISW